MNRYRSSIVDIIKKRKSWRSYCEKPLEPKKRAELIDFYNDLEAPFWKNSFRFNLVDVGPPGKGRMPGTYGVVKGAGTFLVGTVDRGYRDMEDYGYLFEKLILFATQMELATCWIGLTVHRNLLEEKIGLLPNETIPAVTPLGYPAAHRSIVDTVTRASLRATKRKPWKDLFFDETFGEPLERQHAGAYEVPLEMVRLGPSATNKQPWRIVKQNGLIHFFLQRSAGYAKMTSAADLQRIDMGIAMCHFELAAREHSLEGRWAETKVWTEPLPKRCEYIVSWVES